MDGRIRPLETPKYLSLRNPTTIPKVRDEGLLIAIGPIVGIVHTIRPLLVGPNAGVAVHSSLVLIFAHSFALREERPTDIVSIRRGR